MLTRDNFEIVVGNYVYRANGEELRVAEIFPEEDDNGYGKFIAIPMYHIESMEVVSYGNGPVELNTEVDYEAEETIIESKHIFYNAPTAKIDKDITKKKEEYNKICVHIGDATVIKREMERDNNKLIDKYNKEISDLENKISELKSNIKQLIDKYISI